METKQYTNGEVTIRWKPKVCVHSAVCVKTLPQVYHPKEKPWITMENASSAEIERQVSMCPSGALSIQPKFIITQVDNKKNGVFHSIENETKVGLMTYTWADENLFIINHTQVFEGFNGRGIGKELI